MNFNVFWTSYSLYQIIFWLWRTHMILVMSLIFQIPNNFWKWVVNFIFILVWNAFSFNAIQWLNLILFLLFFSFPWLNTFSISSVNFFFSLPGKLIGDNFLSLFFIFFPINFPFFYFALSFHSIFWKAWNRNFLSFFHTNFFLYNSWAYLSSSFWEL